MGKKSQKDKFRDAAREAETDDREETLDRVIRKIAGGGPVPLVEVEQGPEGRKILDKMDKAARAPQKPEPRKAKS